ncbi:histidine phosphatase family protein [Pullulanibacillus sp. KACC 23026]|uniref:histidine phosphatase family protein n=1 Tax=Pullulanibacillus sp. KACC 23026 TaxID=3028315 RepID=UPI0023B04B26|nr:histidine phosphatase family protein [Pullulanibacillus sp. KACC 23026]WEG12206.1 histidine phosphatase family protein [Pullulanibacillus sp. KACC 23026]
MDLYIIRHAQSLLNIGKGDSPNAGLSQFGKEQAICLQEFFRDIHVDVIYSSPLRRVIETANPVADQKKLPIHLAPEMCEFFHELSLDYRDHNWETISDIIGEFPNSQFYKTSPNDQWWPKWPEKEDDVKERVNKFYKEVIQKYISSNSVVLVFGHGATTGELKKIVVEETMNPCPNAGIFKYQINEDGKCVGYKMYIDHLGELTFDLNAKAY